MSCLDVPPDDQEDDLRVINFRVPFIPSPEIREPVTLFADGGYVNAGQSCPKEESKVAPEASAHSLGGVPGDR
jgi:hypothetical protein